ncbi:hypothetical protein SKAU_G00265950 [Synaphobranchus kaupii]|uniref:HTH La-type RNA-binding domain-containing protein n=1 Tax=Synaphobranchus kaupii TaxID=118154 RepID=A0A9Q1EZE9_SYNKA|nr:hypothetical protein SKAU_G00265950 [Synaphobranchus kaupii]
MATQVETLLPNNPLLKQEDHGHASNMQQGEECLEKGAKGTSAADEGSKVKGGESEQGVFATKEQSKKQAKDESNNQEKMNLDQEETNLKDADGQMEEDLKCNKKEFAEAPPPKVNPWTKKINAVTVVSVNGQTHHEQSVPAKVVRAGNPRPRRGGKVGDFGDANNWPTPGEIATKDMQIQSVPRPGSCSMLIRQVREVGPSRRSPVPKKVIVKKESKEKRDSEESKENQKAKSDDSGEEKNGDEDSQKNGQKKKDWHSGKYEREWRDDHVSSVKSEGRPFPRRVQGSRPGQRTGPGAWQRRQQRHFDYYGYKAYDGKDGAYGQKFNSTVTYYYDNMSSNDLYSADQDLLKDYIKRQIEYYFSIDNLERDFFLRRKMDQEGFLPVALIASFHRVQALTTDINLIVEVSSSLACLAKRFLTLWGRASERVPARPPR